MEESHLAHYLEGRLAPQLKDRGLSTPQVAPLLEDVRDRLTSVLSRWNDEAFRRPVLQTGIEEAWFYEPASVELEARALVVVAVRNSLVGDLNADTPATPGLRHSLPDAEMPAITGGAIRYFSEIDLVALAECLSPPQNDVFGPLPAQYPTAWNAISHLARLTGLEASFDPVSAPPPELALPSESDLPPRVTEVVMSGMHPDIDYPLGRILGAIRDGLTDLFFVDSFKYLTRHPRKLYQVLEFILCWEGTFVTHNYCLKNGYVARRRQLLRPAHTTGEVFEKLKFRRRGTTRTHSSTLRVVRQSMS
jgi:hypothetical protein